MSLGNFSVSLAVKDIQSSKKFYETLGFAEIAGDIAQNWLILANGSTKIGLFQGMFERNALTFNPGWADDGTPIENFEDVRVLQGRWKDAGIDVGPEIAAGTSGPASFSIVDPDGNPILIDQHV